MGGEVSERRGAVWARLLLPLTCAVSACSAEAPPTVTEYRLSPKRVLTDEVTGREFVILSPGELKELQLYLKKDNRKNVRDVKLSHYRIGVVREFPSCAVFRDAAKRFAAEASGKQSSEFGGPYFNPESGNNYATFAEPNASEDFRAFPDRGFDFARIDQQISNCQANWQVATKARPWVIMLVNVRKRNGSDYINEVYAERVDYIGHNPVALKQLGKEFLIQFLTP